MSELREAIARVLCRLHLQKVARYDNPPPDEGRIERGVNLHWESHLDAADAALAAINAAGQQIVSKKFSVQPVPGEGLQSKYDFPEGTTVTFSQQGIGGGGGRARGGAEGGPNPRPRSEGQ